MKGISRNLLGKLVLTGVVGLSIVALAAWRPSHTAAKLAGTLPNPVGEMSPTAFHELTTSLTWTGGTDVERRCTGTADCDAGIARTSVRIDATPDSRFVGPKTADANGVIVARIKNNGAFQATMYGFKPGPFEYYFIVYGNKTGSATWSLEEVNTSAGFSHTSIATGTMKGCGHAPAKASKASFQSCDHSSSAIGSSLREGGDQPGWVSCSEGCCTFGIGTD